MSIPNYDQRLEKRHHPENFEPTHDDGENEIGTPMKPSERIEEIVNYIDKRWDGGGFPSRAYIEAIIQYLDEATQSHN